MLSTLVSLALLAGPHGLEANEPVSLVTQLATRLPKWLVHAGDRQEMLATKAEIEDFVKTFPVQPADQADLVKAMIEDQKARPKWSSFPSSNTALIVVTKNSTTVHFFNVKGRATIGLFIDEKTGRYVVSDGPLVAVKSIEQTAELGAQDATLVYLKKSDGAWKVVEPPKKVPPDCNALLKKAAWAVYVAEKSFFAEKDTYETSFDQIGLVLEDGAKATINISGSGATATFTAEVTLNDGVMRITDKSGDPTVLKTCTK